MRSQPSEDPGWRLEPAAFALLRSPLLPFRTLVEWADTGNKREWLRERFRRPDLSEALYVASPSLHARLQGASHGAEDSPLEQAKLDVSLAKYLSRAGFRSTPFGLFAGVTPATTDGAMELPAHDGWSKRRTMRFDGSFEHQIFATLMKDAGTVARLRYVRNTSLYVLGDFGYYAESSDVNGRRDYALVRVELNEVLAAVLDACTAPVPFADLARLIGERADTGQDEAHDYLLQLIESQILTPSATPTQTGQNSFARLHELLPTGEWRETAGRLEAELDALSSGFRAGEHAADPTAAYKRFFGRVRASVPFEVDESRLLQIDLSKDPALPVSIGAEMAARLARAAEMLYLLSGIRGSSLDEFKRKFKARFNGQAVPLTFALNDDLGIAFQQESKQICPLVDGLHVVAAPDPEQLLTWGPFEALMQSRAHRAALERQSTIELAYEDAKAVHDFRRAKPPIPDSLWVQAAFETTREGKVEHVSLQMAGGQSGLEMLGRFCHVDEQLARQARAFASLEADSEHRVYAEIVHLPHDRVGNIVFRPVLRRHEIAFLGASGAERAGLIDVCDLYLFLDSDDRLILFSKTLGKEVVPRLSCAHNYGGVNVALYRFLGLLQYQDRTLIGEFRWPSQMAGLRRLPRVVLEGIMLCPAIWRLGRDEIRGLQEAAAAGGDETTTWRAGLELPRFVTFDEGDGSLPIDLDNPSSVDVLLDEIRGRRWCELREMSSGALPQAPGYTRLECVMPLRRASIDAADAEGARRLGATIASAIRAFEERDRLPNLHLPGSAWTFLNVYTGTAMADEVVLRLAALFEGEIDRASDERWFFIRFHDPEPHIRLRFHIAEDGRRAAVAGHVATRLQQMIVDGLCYAVSQGSYEREASRYGGHRSLLLCEELFEADSRAVVQFLSAAPSDERRWLFGLTMMEAIFQAFGYSPPDTQMLCEASFEYYAKEQLLETRQKVLLGARYRSSRSLIDACFFSTSDRGDLDASSALGHYREAIAEPMRRLIAMIEADEVACPRDSLARDLVHMHCNRLFATRQRLHEAVLYDFLRRISERQSRPAAPRPPVVPAPGPR